MASDNPRFWPALVSAPIITIGTIVFWYKRHAFPLPDREPWIACATAIVVLLLDLSYMIDNSVATKDSSCTIATIAVTLVCIPLGIYTFVCRALLLLFKFSIAGDLERRHRNPSFIGTSNYNTNGNGNGNAQETMGATTNNSGGINNNNNNSGGGDDLKQMNNNTSTNNNNSWGAQVHYTESGGTGGNNYGGGGASVNSVAYVASLSPHSRAIGHTTTGYSWFTRHIHLISPRYLIAINTTIATFFVAMMILVYIMQGPCDDQYGWTGIAFIVAIVLSCIEGVILLLLARQLSKFGRDSIGLKVELRAVAGLVIGTIVIGFPVVILVLNAPELWGILMIICGTLAWSSSVIYPLYLVYQHHQQQLQLANEVQRFSSLADFLKIEKCVSAYADFVSKELSGEGLAFYLRCRTFKSQSTSGHHFMEFAASADVDRIILLSQPSQPSSPVANKQYQASAVARCLREAYQINRSFIVANSPFEVNISAKAKDKIAVHLKAMTAAVSSSNRTAFSPSGGNGGNGAHSVDIASLNHEADVLLMQSILATFDDAMEETLRLLQHNSFTRFRASAAYRQLISSLKSDDDHPTLGGFINNTNANGEIDAAVSRHTKSHHHLPHGTSQSFRYLPRKGSMVHSMVAPLPVPVPTTPPLAIGIGTAAGTAAPSPPSPPAPPQALPSPPTQPVTRTSPIPVLQRVQSTTSPVQVWSMAAPPLLPVIRPITPLSPSATTNATATTNAPVTPPAMSLLPNIIEHDTNTTSAPITANVSIIDHLKLTNDHGSNDMLAVTRSPMSGNSSRSNGGSKISLPAVVSPLSRTLMMPPLVTMSPTSSTFAATPTPVAALATVTPLVATAHHHIGHGRENSSAVVTLPPLPSPPPLSSSSSSSLL